MKESSQNEPAQTQATDPLPPERLAELKAIAERATNRPFLFSDSEGVLKVWALGALKYVTRDETGAVTGWSEPASYTAADLVVEVELDMGTWDPGEDPDDDARRLDIGDMVAAREALPALLAKAEFRRGATEELINQRDDIELTVSGWQNGKVTADAALKAIDRIIQGGAS